MTLLLLSAAATLLGTLLLYQLAVWFASGKASDFVKRQFSGAADAPPATSPVQTASVEASESVASVQASDPVASAQAHDAAEPPGGAVSRESPPVPLGGPPPEVSAETPSRAGAEMPGSTSSPARGPDSTSSAARVPDSTSSPATLASEEPPAGRSPAASAARPESAGTAGELVPGVPVRPGLAEAPSARGGVIYRVQVAAAPDSGAARRAAARVEQLLGARVPVRVEIVPPYYKVRVGDFADRAAAGPLLERLREAGYPDAWIAESGDQPR